MSVIVFISALSVVLNDQQRSFKMKWKCPKCGDTEYGWEVSPDNKPSNSNDIAVAIECQACCEYFWLIPEKLIPYSEG